MLQLHRFRYVIPKPSVSLLLVDTTIIVLHDHKSVYTNYMCSVKCNSLYRRQAAFPIARTEESTVQCSCCRAVRSL